MAHHLAILKNPWYDAVINGTKTIESRWYKRKMIPYEKDVEPDKQNIHVGDWIYLKKSGRPWVTYEVEILDFAFFEGDDAINELRRLKKQIYIDDLYIQTGLNAQKDYLSLFYLGKRHRLERPFTFNQHGQTAFFVNYIPKYDGVQA